MNGFTVKQSYAAFVAVMTGVLLSSLPSHAATELTLYQDGQALVKEQRQLPLKAGKQTLTLKQFPLRLDPDSVLVQAEKGPAWAMRQQQFRYDSLERITILNGLLGETVRFTDFTLNGSDEPPVIESGILRSGMQTSAGSFGYNRTPGGLYVVQEVLIETKTGLRPVPVQAIVLDKVPASLALEPEVKLTLEAEKAGTADVALAYFTEGLPWNLQYVAIISNKQTLSLQGQLNLENQTGKAWKDVTLSLVPAALNKASRQQPQEQYQYKVMRSMAMADMAAGAAPEATHLQAKVLGDYPLYRFPTTLDLDPHTRQQLAWLSAEEVPFEKRYVFDPNPGSLWLGFGYVRPVGESEAHPNQQIESRIRFYNKKPTSTEAKRTLGQSLPGGAIKVFQEDADGHLQWVGGDTLQATPEGQAIELTLGQAFDLLAEKKQVSFRQLKKGYEADYEVTLKNRSEKAATMDVLDHPYGEWKLLASSVPPVEKRGNTLRFSVPVPAKGEVTLTYSVQQR